MNYLRNIENTATIAITAEAMSFSLNDNEIEDDKIYYPRTNSMCVFSDIPFNYSNMFILLKIQIPQIGLMNMLKELKGSLENLQRKFHTKQSQFLVELTSTLLLRMFKRRTDSFLMNKGSSLTNKQES